MVERVFSSLLDNEDEQMRIPLFRKRGPTAVDPVCHMDVDTQNPPGGIFEHDGVAYYFCSPGCNRAFQKDPQAYLSGAKNLNMES